MAYSDSISVVGRRRFAVFSKLRDNFLRCDRRSQTPLKPLANRVVSSGSKFLARILNNVLLLAAMNCVFYEVVEAEVAARKFLVVRAFVLR